MNETLYRRPLPGDAIAFSSSVGRRIFAEALNEGTLDGYFRLAEQFHTQSEPAFCGLGSLVVALNALGIDPGRLWKGPWRWFAEDLLDCCVPLSEVRERGLDLDEVACLARCNGAEVVVQRAEETSQLAFRDALREAARAETVLLAAYDRSALGQAGAGHFSPLGGYHAARDLVLILDVARFKTLHTGSQSSACGRRCKRAIQRRVGSAVGSRSGHGRVAWRWPSASIASERAFAGSDSA